MKEFVSHMQNNYIFTISNSSEITTKSQSSHKHADTRPHTFVTMCYEPLTPIHTQQTLTEAAELADDVGQADIGNTFQLTADVVGDGLATHMPRLYVPCNQRHGEVWWVEGPNPGREEKGVNLSQKYTIIEKTKLRH